MSLINEDLSSSYKISISVYTIDSEGRDKTKVEEWTQELKLNSNQLENLIKYLKNVNGSLIEWSVD
jgi:hypothetical protein